MTTRESIEGTVRRFYEGCNEGNADKLHSCLAAGAVHFFPIGSAVPIFRSPQELVDGWQSAIRRFDSRWTLDRLLIDETSREGAIEWTHFRPAVGGCIRGAELCCFDEQARITEIRPYYAIAPATPGQRCELEAFPYAQRGYATHPPDVVRRF